MPTINLPFSGFYDSLWSDIVEQFGEYENEKQESREYHPEEYMPEPLRVDVTAFAWEFVDYSAAHLKIAQAYVEAFAEWLDDQARDLNPKTPDLFGGAVA